ncbi:MAG: integrase [Pseudonocardiales bacterium]|jgi:site-specific recombinase XerD|nr:integrase [Pseudonocardiales bacterium]
MQWTWLYARDLGARRTRAAGPADASRGRRVLLLTHPGQALLAEWRDPQVHEAQLGIQSHLHALRHYSATELLSSGIDLRTVAGRLGHGGGGATTLRVYAKFVTEPDRQAAEILGRRVKRRPS